MNHPIFSGDRGYALETDVGDLQRAIAALDDRLKRLEAGRAALTQPPPVKRKPDGKPRLKKCPIWPRCTCIAQGYVNEADRRDSFTPPCGKRPVKRKPAKRSNKARKP